MPERFRDKYRIPPARAQWWDYGRSAAYFVTICTAGMECWFSKIASGEMELSAIGHIVEEEWLKTFAMRPDMNLEMGAFIVMPNHFHAVIIIGNNDFNSEDIFIKSSVNKFGVQSKNLASIIRGFKIGVTRNARQLNPDFSWQASYHDHIIKNGESYNTITNYIINNPNKWDEDRFYSR